MDSEYAARVRWDNLAKPLGSLGLLEDAVVQIAALTGNADIDLSRRVLLVFCADNGVVAQGGTQTAPPLWPGRWRRGRAPCATWPGRLTAR